MKNTYFNVQEFEAMEIRTSILNTFDHTIECLVYHAIYFNLINKAQNCIVIISKKDKIWKRFMEEGMNKCTFTQKIENENIFIAETQVDSIYFLHQIVPALQEREIVLEQRPNNIEVIVFAKEGYSTFYYNSELEKSI